MKTFEYITDRDRAELLYILFPAQIPAFLAFTQNLCTSVLEVPPTLKDIPDKCDLTYSRWEDTVKSAGNKIQQENKLLIADRAAFAELFDDERALFFRYALFCFTQIRRSEDENFNAFAKLLFNLNIFSICR